MGRQNPIVVGARDKHRWACDYTRPHPADTAGDARLAGPVMEHQAETCSEFVRRCGDRRGWQPLPEVVFLRAAHTVQASVRGQLLGSQHKRQR